MASLRGNPNREYDKLKKAAADARLPFDKDMLLNLAFFLDHQYTEWVSDWNTIRSIPRREGYENTPRPVANKIFHFVVQEHAQALANRPTPDVLPATADPADVSLTAVALAYLKSLADVTVCDFDSELSEATFWALVAGEGFLKWTFNAKSKRPDICAPSPLDVFTDPYATRFKHARYVIHSQFMDVQQIYDLYGVEVKPSKMDRADAAKAALMRDMGQAPVLDGAVVNELWLRPGTSRRRPRGAFRVWCGREVLEERDFPYKHGHLPFTQIGSVPLLKTPHYTCAVKYLREPQTELNVYHQQRLMVRRAFSNPKWWVPDELEMETDPDDSPAQILRGNSSGGTVEPKILQPTIFPENRDGDWIRQEMQDVVGLHEVSQAQVPGRVEAARAIELLKEADDGRLAELSRTIRNATGEGFWQCLMLAKQYVPGEDIVQTYSREGMPEVKRFKAADFKPGMRVIVTMGTGLSDSRAARMDAALNLWERQVIQDPEVVAELIELPVGVIAPQRELDMKLARNENLLMSEGTPVKPNSWDAHAIHLREHNNYRKTAEYEGLSDKAKKVFEFHCQSHEAMELQQLQKEAQKMAIMQGAAAGPQPQPQPQPNPAGVPEDQALQPQPEDNQPVTP